MKKYLFVIMLCALYKTDLAQGTIDFGTIKTYNSRDTELLMRAGAERQKRYDQNLNHISELLTWINKLKTQTNEQLFIEEINIQAKFLNSLLEGNKDLAIYTKEIMNSQSKIEQSITSYNYRVQALNKKKEEENNPENIYKSGLRKIDNDDISGALSDFNKFIEIAPNSYVGHYYAGYCYFLQKNYVKAIPCLEKAISIEQKYFIYNVKGWAEYYLGNYTTAVSDFTNQIELAKDNPYAYYNRGSAKSELSDYYGAISDYSRAIELDPDFSMAYNNLGWVYFKKKEYKTALIHLNKAIEKDSTNYTAFDSRAETKFMLNDFKGAIIDCDKATELNPQLSNSYFIKGRAYYRLGKKDKACENWSFAGQYGSAKAYEYISKYCK